MARLHWRDVLLSWCVLAFSAALLAVFPPAASAQFSAVWSPSDARPGETINIFATWEGQTAIDGFDLELTGGAVLRDAHVLRFGRDRLPVRISSRDGIDRLLVEQSRRAPHEIVITLELPATGLGTEWRLTPLQTDSDGTLAPMYGAAEARSISYVPAPSSDEDLAASFADAEGPLLLRREHVPVLSGSEVFEVRFWMRTTSLQEVVLSTWDGTEGIAYPLELEIGPAGRLFVFRSTGKVHESISSRRPVADGQWHEIRIASDGRRTVLWIDGDEVDAFTSPVTVPERATSVAVGGRLPQRGTGIRTYSGWIDDLIMTSESEGFPPGARAPRSLRVSFDEDVDRELLAPGSADVRHEPARRVRSFAPHELTAELLSRGIRLEWQAAVLDGGWLQVERSRDGRSFEPIATIDVEPEGDQTSGRFEYLEEEAHDGVHYYRIVHTLPDGRHLASRALKVGLATPPEESVELIGNFPNPFNRSTTIAYRIAQSRNVQLSVWDLSGQQLAVLVDEVAPEGYHEVRFEAGDLPSGTYFVRLQTPNRTVSRKMILAR